MDDGDSKELERDFSERVETLRSFYNTDALEMSDDEAASLTPILNSLKDHDFRYHEIEKIAEGGEKKITLAHDHRLDRRVAMARAVRNAAPQDLEQFLREARLTANLAHPNIMPVYNMGLDVEGEPFFSMELIPGDSLKSIIRKLRDADDSYRMDYPVETLLNIFMKVCDAIAYAHSRNVLHLDIKPDNIRVGEFGEVLVCDWGLARVINAEEDFNGTDSTELDGDILNDMTLSGTMKGTPGFMAPEQTQAYGEKTPQTDIYSLGALLYMLLTFKLPVEGSSAQEVIQNTRAGKVISPRRRRPERRVPKGLVAVIMKALALEPEKRYGSVMELSREIQQFLSGHPNACGARRMDYQDLAVTAAAQSHCLPAYLLPDVVGLCHQWEFGGDQPGKGRSGCRTKECRGQLPAVQKRAAGFAGVGRGTGRSGFVYRAQPRLCECPHP